MRTIEAALATAADPSTFDQYVQSDRHFADQKVDGHRGLLHIDDGRIAMISRQGLDLPVKPYIYEPFKPLLTMGRWVFDGEYLNGQYYLFDIVEGGGFITPATPYEERRLFLGEFYGRWNPQHVHLIPVYRTTEGKARLVEQISSQGGEGVMFKVRTAPYRSGRTDSIVKAKFRNDVDCVVTRLGMDGKANMQLSLYTDDGVLVEVGHCTALAGDGPRVKVGDVVTVIYQNASKGHRLIMPTKPKIRTDKTSVECTLDQLVYTNKEVFL